MKVKGSNPKSDHHFSYFDWQLTLPGTLASVNAGSEVIIFYHSCSTLSGHLDKGFNGEKVALAALPGITNDSPK